MDHLASLDLTRADAVLFDMDGTLLDSYAVVERTWGRFAARHGLDEAAVLGAIHGIPAETSVRQFLPDADAAAVAAEVDRLVVEECADVAGVVALPGAHALIAYLDAAGTPWAVVTSAVPELATARLAAAGFAAPRVLVTPHDTARGKPHPDPFLEGARRCGVPAERCLAVEDSPGGLAAARASGSMVVDVGPGGTTLVALLARLRDA